MRAVSPAVAGLLRVVARRLQREAVYHALGIAAWISLLVTLATLAVHLTYRAVDPLTPVLFVGITFAVAIGWAALRWPSASDAAAFVDRRLDGRCAYRTLRELEAKEGRHASNDAAAAAFLEWVESHAARGPAMLAALAAPPKPMAALASAAVALSLAIVIVRLPGVAVAFGSVSTASDAPYSAVAAKTLTRSRSLFDGDSERRGADALPEARMKAVLRGGIPHQTVGPQADANARAAAKFHLSQPLLSAANGNTANGNALAPGTAHDASLATQLSRTLEFGAIKRVVTGSTRSASGQATGQALDASESPLSGRRGDAVAPAVPPPQALTSSVTGPAQRLLVTRYFKELAQHR